MSAVIIMNPNKAYSKKVFSSLYDVTMNDFVEWLYNANRFTKEKIIYVQELTEDELIDDYDSFLTNDRSIQYPVRYYMYKSSSYLNNFDALNHLKCIKTMIISMTLDTDYTLSMCDVRKYEHKYRRG